MRRRLIVTVGVAALGLVAWSVARPDTGDGHWERVARRDLVLEVEVTGSLRSSSSLQLGAPNVEDMWNFKISFLAPEGSTVDEGEPVIGFDTTELQQRLLTAQADLDSAKAHLERRRQALEQELGDARLALEEARAQRRKTTLEVEVPEDLVSRHELDTSRVDHRLAGLEVEHLEKKLQAVEARGMAEVAALEQRLTRAERKVANLGRDIAAMTVTAPTAGTVVYVTDWRGNKFKVGDSAWRMWKIVELPDLDAMVADGEIEEVDAGRVTIGQPVKFRLDAHQGIEYSGRIRSVRKSVQPRSRRDPTKVVEIEIDLDSVDSERMRPGLRFRGGVEVERIRSVLAVPLGAVHGGAEPWVEVGRALGATRKVTPTLGRHDDHWTEVVDGLEEGQRVLVPDGDA